MKNILFHDNKMIKTSIVCFYSTVDSQRNKVFWKLPFVDETKHQGDLQRTFKIGG